MNAFRAIKMPRKISRNLYLKTIIDELNLLKKTVAIQ